MHALHGTCTIAMQTADVVQHDAMLLCTGRPAACNQLAVPYLATDEHYVPPEWAAHLALVGAITQ